jgi:hypothetical protein
MAELIVENGPRAGTKVPLSREHPCTVGSDGGCTLALEGVGAQQIVVKALKEEGFGIKGLHGPAVVNGAPVPAARLRHGDRIDVGPHRLRFAERSEPAPALAPANARPRTPVQPQVAAQAPAAVATPGLPTSAAPDSPPAPAAPEGRQLGGFRLLSVLGKGGMGVVYRAEQVSLHREVALKVLSHELTRDPVFVARFVAEARAAARLSHPNVVQVFDVGHDGDTYYYSMELMHNSSLETRLRRDGRLPPKEAAKLVADAAKGLAYAESLRIVHRDIKPDNLMLDQHGHCKIADLGLALTDQDDTSKIVGTPHFMAPEQALRKPVDPRTDLYSLGCTFFRLVTGKTPFNGASSKDILRAQVQDEPPLAHKVEAAVPQELGAVIQKLMQKDPAARYQSSNDLLAELEQLLAPPHRKGLWIGTAAAAVVVAGLAVGYVLTRPEKDPQVIRVTEKDPRAAELAEENRRKDAEIARMRVEKEQAGKGLALAEALEAMAAAHPDTPAAQAALQRSRQVRAEEAEKARRKAERERALRAAIEQWRQQFDPVLEHGDFLRAAELLQARSIPDELRADPGSQAAIQDGRTRLLQKAAARRAELEQALDAAEAGRDPDATRTAADALAAIARDDGGWPALVLGDRKPVLERTSAAHRRAEKWVAERRTAAEAAAWQQYATAWTGASGVLQALLRFDFDRGTQLAATAAQAAAGMPPEARSKELQEAAAQALRYLQAVATHALTGNLEAPLEEGSPPVPITGLALTERGGLTIRTGTKAAPKTQVVPFGELKPYALLHAFSLPPNHEALPARAAFLGLYALAEQLAAARAHLTRITRDDDQSGTGAGGLVAPREVLAAAEGLLQAETAPWAKALLEELRAAERLALGLRALSDRRNVAAAGHLEALQQDLPRALVVLALQ